MTIKKLLTSEQFEVISQGKNTDQEISAPYCCDLLSVAMGNALNEVKARAAVICRSVEEDGVYHYCLENHLI